MSKKILFIVGSIFIGIILLLTSWYSGLYFEYQRVVLEAIENGDYTTAERYYAYAMDGIKICNKEQNDGTYVEVFYAVNTKNKDVYDVDGDTYLGTYEAYYKTIQISMFNVSNEFDLLNGGENSKVVAVVNGVSFEFPFVTETVNAYEDYFTYGFINLSIYEDEFNEKIKTNKLSADAKITSIQIIDDSKEVKYELRTGHGINFTNTFHDFIDKDLEEYGKEAENALLAYHLDSASTLELKPLDLSHITEKNGFYKTHFTIESAKSSSNFKTPFIISIFLVIGLDIGLAVFLFKKRPDTNIPTAEVVSETVEAVIINEVEKTVEATVLEDIEE